MATMSTDGRETGRYEVMKQQMRGWVDDQLEKAADSELPPALIAELRLQVQLPQVTRPLPTYETYEW